jgi:hypothetical protein
LITAAELIDYLQIQTPAWVTAKGYNKGDYVVNSGTVYECVTGHTSGTFATDLEAGKWTSSHFIQSAVNHAISKINSYCNRDFRQASYTDYYTPESSGNKYYLANPPGSEIASIKYHDGTQYVTIFGTGDNIGNSTRLEKGKLILFNGYSFTAGTDYEIVYTGGYASADMPELIKGIAKEIAAVYYKSSAKGGDRLGLGSQNTGGQSTDGKTFDIEGLTERHKSDLYQYRIQNV